jgi:hypothetical protein
MLTKTEAIEFLQNDWKIEDVERQLQNDRENFLNKLIVTAHEMVPFQVLFLRKLAFIPSEERKLPTVEEIDHMCMSGDGGNCTVINMFMSRLLKALGYSAFVCLSIVTNHTFNPHLIVIIKDLVNTGDLHLVDCGLGLPSFRAISLNFNEESPIYRDSFLEYKFIKLDGKVLRMHGDGDSVVHNDPPVEGLDFIRGKWRRFYEFTIETLGCENLEALGPVVAIAKYCLPKYKPRAARFPGGKAILLNEGNILSIEQEDKTLKTVTLQSKEEALQVFKSYFPSISEDLVQQAYSTWQKSRL